MDAKKLILLVGALFTAAITAVMAKHLAGTTAAPVVMAAPAQPVGPQVLVATKPLAVGTILGPDSVRFQPWPKDLVDGAYYVRGAPGVDPAKLQGTVVRNAITAGQPITQGSLVAPGDRGFLAAALTPGMRAVTVSVSAATSVAGFVFPGDRVDVLLTQAVAGSDGAQGLNATETIVRNVRVLATDQRTDNQPNPEGKTDVHNFSLVTVEATPKLAEKIAVAEKIGALSLSLRPLADDTQELERAIASGDLKVPAGTDPRAENKMMLDLASKPQDTNTTFTTGGEVSRFQRSTLPPPPRSMATGGFAQGYGAGVPAASAPAGSSAAPAASIVVHVPPSVRVSRGNAVSLMPIVG